MQENKTELLKAITQFTGQLVLKDDLASVSKTFLTALKEVKKQLETVAQQDRENGNLNNDALNSAIKSLRDEMTNESAFNDQKTLERVKEAVDNLSAQIAKVKASIPPVTNLKPVYDKIDSLDILTMNDIEKELPKFGTSIRDGLELLQGDERLDKSAIKGLDEELNKVKGMIPPPLIPTGGRQLTGSSFSFTGDDSTTLFYLASEPAGKGMFVWAHYQGQWLQKGVHYTITGKRFDTSAGTDPFVAATGGIIEGFIINF